MISQATDTTLRAMKLTGMANELARQIANPKSVREMSFDERLAQLVDAEWRKRQASKMEKCIHIEGKISMRQRHGLDAPVEEAGVTVGAGSTVKGGDSQ